MAARRSTDRQVRLELATRRSARSAASPGRARRCDDQPAQGNTADRPRSANRGDRRPGPRQRRRRAEPRSILGDLPVLGALFRSSKKVVEDQPAPRPDAAHRAKPERSRAIFERKMQERQEFIDRYTVFSDEELKTSARFLPRERPRGDIRQSIISEDEPASSKSPSQGPALARSVDTWIKL